MYNPAYYQTPKAREKHLAASRRRRKLMQEAGQKHPLDDNARKAVFEKYSYCCAYCGKDCSTEHHIDHKLPLVRGGDNHIDNLALACPQCNAKKGTKTDVEFVGHKV